MPKLAGVRREYHRTDIGGAIMNAVNLLKAARIEPIKRHIGGIVHVTKEHLLDQETIAAVRDALEDRGVLVFPRLNLTNAEQLGFTDKLGKRVNFTRKAPGSGADGEEDIYAITLDKEVNNQPEYVLGTFFWHIDGVSADTQVLKTTVLSARKIAETGGETEFANLYAAYDNLPEEEKGKLQGLRVIHSVEASLRPVYGVNRVERDFEFLPFLAPEFDHVGP